MTDLMRTETLEIPQAAARLEDSRPAIAQVAARLRLLAPPALITVARGSSDHAANVWKYAVEIGAGLPVASMGPSVASIHGAKLNVAGLAALAFSQSGASEDIIALSGALRAGGAMTVAMTNTPDSPLANACDHTIDLQAGPERAVAATKSYVNTVLAGLRLLAEWREDAALHAALDAAPDRLTHGLMPCDRISEALAAAPWAVVLGRGPGLGIARELALKAAECCAMPALALSAAEALHGPVAAIGPEAAVIAIGEGPGIDGPLDALATHDINPLRITTAPLHPILDPLLALPSLYLSIEQAARARGHDPDAPRRLKKETVTR